MTDAKQIADKYISRGGGAPVWDRDEFVRDLISLGSFILWHKDGDMCGGVKKGEAFAAFCRLTNVEPHRIEAILKNDR